jgi:hypothetical protein
MDKNNIIKIALITVLIIAIYFTVNSAIKKIGEKQTEKQAGKEVNKSNLTYSQSQYEAFADKLEDAVTYWGTDETAIYNVMDAMKTKDDILNLIAAFGTRMIYGFFSKEEMNLVTALNRDLKNKEIDRINNILANNGIDYKF